MSDKTMSLDVALDFADNPRPYHTLQAPADTNSELYEALRVLAAAYRAKNTGDQLRAELAAAKDESERYREGFRRYETVRRMSVVQFKSAMMLNLSTGKPFDQIIDELAPFANKGDAPL